MTAPIVRVNSKRTNPRDFLGEREQSGGKNKADKEREREIQRKRATLLRAPDASGGFFVPKTFLEAAADAASLIMKVRRLFRHGVRADSPLPHRRIRTRTRIEMCGSRPNFVGANKRRLT